ncbi:MAG: hypothetical protein LZ173_10335, partial [Thaumarchaeota archaeon]|nr:hypothetical protein [Candidatus Geocrenenecus arthurdayi]
GRGHPHVVFDGERFYEVDRLTKLEDAGEVYIDSLFPTIYSDILGLLKNRVKVFLLTNTRILRKLRLENNLRKTHQNDAFILSRIPREWFRELTIEEVEFKMKLRPVIKKYEWLVRWKGTLKGLITKGFDYYFRESVKLIEEDLKKAAKEIIYIVSNSRYVEVYRRVCDVLRVKDSVEVAVLVMELPLHLGVGKLRAYLGLNPVKNNQYNRRLRRHLEALAYNTLINYYRRKKDEAEEFISIVKNASSRGEVMLRIQLKILRILRKAWIEANNQTRRDLLANEQ